MALLVVGVVVSGYLIYDAVKGRDFVVRVHEAAEPGVDFFGAIRAERRLTLEALAGSPSQRELAEQRAATDAATRNLMNDVDGMVDGASDEIRGVIERLRGQLGELQQFRGRVDGGGGPNGPTLQDAYDLYNRIIDTVAAGLTGVARLTPDAETAYLRVQSMPLFTAADGMARADALAAAGHVVGGLTDEEFRTYAGQVGAYRAQLARASMTPEVRAQYEQLVGSDAWRVVTRVENAFLEGGTQQVPVSPERWHEAANEVGGALMSLYIEQSTHATNEGIDRADRTLVGALVAGGASLVVGSLLIFFAWRLAQWLVRRLVRLREETLDLADNRLPDLVGRVREGENVDVVELESADHGEDEIGQVADAFSKAQRTAVAAAIEESRVREGTKTVFLNIAHRSQVLVHRQLKAIDDVEQHLDDPEQLEMLFRVDHFATRARRNAENLIILGGQQPGRRWRNPVSIADLVRGANAEIEQYRRVDVAVLPDVAVIGPAVGDVVHLLAELLDNATAFSPPDSRVVVRGDAAEAKGVVLEVEDQGLGIEEEDVERLNALLAEPPDFSFMALSDEPRLGLFVVARLAARHGIQVRLREAIHGGTRAVVRLDPELLGTWPEHDRRDGRPRSESGPDTGSGAAVGWPTAEPPAAAGTASAGPAGGPGQSGTADTAPSGAATHDSRTAGAQGGGRSGNDETGDAAGSGPGFATAASVSAILSGSQPKVEAPGAGWFRATDTSDQHGPGTQPGTQQEPDRQQSNTAGEGTSQTSGPDGQVQAWPDTDQSERDGDQDPQPGPDPRSPQPRGLQQPGMRQSASQQSAAQPHGLPQPTSRQRHESPSPQQRPESKSPGGQQAESPQSERHAGGQQPQPRRASRQRPWADQRSESWPSTGVTRPVDEPGRAPSVQDRFLRDETSGVESPDGGTGAAPHGQTGQSGRELPRRRRPESPAGSQSPSQQPPDGQSPVERTGGRSSAPDVSTPGLSTPGLSIPGPSTTPPGSSESGQPQSPAGASGGGMPPRPRNPLHHSGEQAAVPPVPGAVSAGEGAGPAGVAGSGGGAAGTQSKPTLPRRRKQENLAPQLREAPQAAPEPSTSGTEDRGAHADAARNRFAGFQRGTQRARQDQGKREGTGLFASGEGPR
ncbi:nitrate- and nitrite sensing domain-containing protein [Prauserella alba]|uniref:nitrate- and nitrite sensing domain-containing protein n=1 Tax=Prauserella alba TaxID=176898 RepID=UPI0020A416CC|nr:nitrate- and nitrite sensing domain-containing protein [Prauserella alba]